MSPNIIEKLKRIDTHFKESGHPLTERERVLGRTVKLSEEVGELCEAVLHEYDPHQRPKAKAIDLDSELADVVICTLLLSLGRERNIFDEIDQKLDAQLERFGLTNQQP